MISGRAKAYLNAFGQGKMDHKADIGFVYAHAKGNLHSLSQSACTWMCLLAGSSNQKQSVL